ncbi:MAG: preprotein translocase subunit SecE [Magnetococcales bacterium]|nr:preprotein translocase subunit SecE [Magnetococcales bacterium]MBF0175822.1 preprotein translocase subunit SecE [Magnetococcales bacterium]MBF0322145.1 preprotein translocase subunit SecE [Magnetococcales bacterium]
MIQVSEVKQYLSDVRNELRKVVWPTRKDTSNTTILVLAMVFLVSLFLWLIDSVLSLLVRLVVG